MADSVFDNAASSDAFSPEPKVVGAMNQYLLLLADET